MSDDLELLKLAVEIELADSDYEGRSHFSRNLYAEGCHGPLCTYRERIKAARRYAARNPKRQPRARKPGAVERDAYLDGVLLSLYGEVPTELRATA